MAAAPGSSRIPLALPGRRAGTVVDGERFVGSAVRFARALRMAGLTTDLSAAIDFARALGVVDLGEREQVRAAGASLFVRRRDDLEVYDAVFARFWRSRGLRLGADAGPNSLDTPAEVVDDDDPGSPDPDAASGDDRREAQPREDGLLRPGEELSDEPESAEEIDGLIISEQAYSAGRSRGAHRVVGLVAACAVAA